MTHFCKAGAVSLTQVRVTRYVFLVVQSDLFLNFFDGVIFSFLRRRWWITINPICKARGFLDAEGRGWAGILTLLTNWRLCASMHTTNNDQRNVRCLKNYLTHVADVYLKDTLGKKCAKLSLALQVASGAVLCFYEVLMAWVVRFVKIVLLDGRRCHFICSCVPNLFFRHFGRTLLMRFWVYLK